MKLINLLQLQTAVVAGLGNAISSRGRKAAEQAEQRRRYLDYLETLRRDLQQRSDGVREAAALLHPAPEALLALVRDPARLWERRRRDDDYLRARVGTGAVPWFTLSVPKAVSPVQPQDPYLLAEATAVRDRFSTVPAMPVTVDLRDVQIAARHADPRTTMRYDRARNNLDRHPNYILAAYMASGT